MNYGGPGGGPFPAFAKKPTTEHHQASQAAQLEEGRTQPAAAATTSLPRLVQLVASTGSASTGVSGRLSCLPARMGNWPSPIRDARDKIEGPTAGPIHPYFHACRRGQNPTWEGHTTIASTCKMAAVQYGIGSGATSWPIGSWSAHTRPPAYDPQLVSRQSYSGSQDPPTLASSLPLSFFQPRLKLLVSAALSSTFHKSLEAHSAILRGAGNFL